MANTSALLAALKSILPFVPNKKLKQKHLQNILFRSDGKTLSLMTADGVSIGQVEVPTTGPEFAFLLSVKQDQQKSLEMALKSCTLENMVVTLRENGSLHFEGIGLTFHQDTPTEDYPNLQAIFDNLSPAPGTNFSMTASQLEKLAKAAKAFATKNPVYEMVFNGDNQPVLAHLRLGGAIFKALLMPDSG